MTKEILQEIVNLKDFQKIETEIVSKGKYFNMAWHPTLKKINLAPIIQSKNFVLLDRVRDYKYAFDLGFADEVAEYPDYQFIWLQVDKYDKSCNAWLPHILKMYAKEKEKV